MEFSHKVSPTTYLLLLKVPRSLLLGISIWVFVQVMVFFWVRNIIRHLVFREHKRDHNFDNHPFGLRTLLFMISHGLSQFWHTSEPKAFGKV